MCQWVGEVQWVDGVEVEDEVETSEAHIALIHRGLLRDDWPPFFTIDSGARGKRTLRARRSWGETRVTVQKVRDRRNLGRIDASIYDNNEYPLPHLHGVRAALANTVSRTTTTTTAWITSANRVWDDLTPKPEDPRRDHDLVFLWRYPSRA